MLFFSNLKSAPTSKDNFFVSSNSDMHEGFRNYDEGLFGGRGRWGSKGGILPRSGVSTGRVRWNVDSQACLVTFPE